jgi:hypothetical protein
VAGDEGHHRHTVSGRERDDRRVANVLDQWQASVAIAATSGVPRGTTATDEYEQRSTRDTGKATAAPLTSGRLKRPSADARSGRIAIVVRVAGLTPAFAAKQVCHDGVALLLLAKSAVAPRAHVRSGANLFVAASRGEIRR